MAIRVSVTLWSLFARQVRQWICTIILKTNFFQLKFRNSLFRFWKSLCRLLQGEEIFLDMFEDEWRELHRRPLNVEFLLQDASILLPPAGTPLTGIDFDKRLPCGEVGSGQVSYNTFVSWNHLKYQESFFLYKFIFIYNWIGVKYTKYLVSMLLYWSGKYWTAVLVLKIEVRF